MIYLLIHNNQIRGAFTSQTRATQAANDIKIGYGDVGWGDEELGADEVYFVARGNQKIRILKIEQDKLLSLGVQC